MRKLLAVFLIVILVASVSVSVAGAAGKPPTPKVVGGFFIDYEKPDKPGKPDKPPGKPEPPPEEPKVYDYYELIGPSWDLSKYDGGVPYVIDERWAPEGASDEIMAAYDAWDAAVSAELFNDAVGFAEAEVGFDGRNSVTWRKWLPRDIVAFAAYWYWDNDFSGTPTEGDEMLEVDISFNLFHKWSVAPDKKAFHVRNVATHEVGHMVGLADLYDEVYSELTMYGYVKKGETKKTSLEEGDILGAQWLY